MRFHPEQHRDPFVRFHPLLATILRKMADPAFSVRDVVDERLDWVQAGCPVVCEHKNTRQTDAWGQGYTGRVCDDCGAYD